MSVCEYNVKKQGSVLKSLVFLYACCQKSSGSVSGSLSGFLHGVFAVGEICHRCGHEDGAECADNHAADHCECECADGFTAEDEDAHEHEQSGERCHHRTSECGVDGPVNLVEHVVLGIELDVFAHTVKDNHGVVDLVADHGEDRGYECLVDLHGEGHQTPEEGVEADDGQCGEGHCGEGAE